MRRVIGHLDLDYFYAQVEEVENPSIRDRPVVVCVYSGRTEDSGAVATANYKARSMGVKSGVPISLAKRKLDGSDAVFIKMEHEKYEKVSENVMELVRERVDVLEPTGIDEAFFDITDASGGDFIRARGLGEGIKEAVLKETSLTCSIGLGRSKVVAKLASDAMKPNGLTIIPPESTSSFLDPLRVERLYGVGPKATAALRQLGILTVLQLSRTDPSALEAALGRNLSSYLLAASTGSDLQPVQAGRAPTQFGRMVTLKQDTRRPDEILGQLEAGIESVAKKLSDSKSSFRTLTAMGVLTDLSIMTKNKTFSSPMIADGSKIRESFQILLADLCNASAKDLRRAGVRVSGLATVEAQSNLFEFEQETRG
ncbi:MAG: DNA polymerase IV [archaeon]|nr:MAG: DNA polymerase IV [archaeon]